jgi:SNF2 family DNA or RNA helicase
MRSQLPWLKRKRDPEMLGSVKMGKLLEDSVKDDKDDFGNLFDKFVLQTIDEKIKMKLQKKRRLNVFAPTFVRPFQLLDDIESVESKPNGYHIQPDFGFSILQPMILYPHQIDSIKWAKHVENHGVHGIRGGILSLEMGLGKTLVALSMFQCDNYAPNMFICNKSLLGSISQDIKKFFGDSMPFFILHPDNMKRKLDDLDASWFDNYKFILTTYDVILGLGKRSGVFVVRKSFECDKRTKSGLNFFGMKFHRIICDESQRIVNPKSQIFQCLQKIQSNYRICLSGTPIRNYDKDLHTQLLFCGLDPKIKWSVEMYKKLELRNYIHCVSIKQANVDLPEKEIIQLDLDFTDDELSIYKSVHKISVDTYTDFSAGKTTFAAVLLQFLRLRQVCIAPFMVDDKKDILLPLDRQRHGLCSTKILRTINIIEQTPTEDKVIIFSSFTSALSLMKDALKLHMNYDDEVVMVHGCTTGKKRELLFENFRNNPKVKVLLITNSVGCMGLNLTVANHVILLETWWNDTVGDQAAARVWRIGQTKKVYIWRLIIKNSIEQKMLNMCQSKNDMTDTYLNDSGLNKDILLEIFQS